VPIRVARDGHEIEIRAFPSPRASVVARRGVSLDGALIAPIVSEDSTALTEPAHLVVQSVEDGSAASTEDIEEMDIIQTVDGQRFDTLDALVAYLDRRHNGPPLHIVFRRPGSSLNHWFAWHVRELPNADTHVVGPEPELLSTGR
jgi:PDZ domain-containing secreted protein